MRTATQAGYHWFCSGCHGRAVTLPVLRKSLERGFISACLTAGWETAPASGPACPVCRNAMREAAASGRQCLLRVDVCFPCQLVWFDVNEFEAAPGREFAEAIQHAGIAEDEKPPLPQAAREALALAEVESLANRASDGTPDDPWKTVPAFFGLPVETHANVLSRLPLATWSLAAIISAVSLLAMTDLNGVVEAWGLVPAQWTRSGGVTLITSFFLHGGFLHLISNLYFLLVFGDDVEDFLGRKRFLLLMAASTLAGDVAHILAEPRGDIPCIGASGGISGVLAFYALRFPEAKLSLMWWGWWTRFVPHWIEFDAVWLFLLWLVIQSLGLLEQISGHGEVSSLAHLGGVAAGAAAWLVWRERG